MCIIYDILSWRMTVQMVLCIFADFLVIFMAISQKFVSMLSPLTCRSKNLFVMSK